MTTPTLTADALRNLISEVVAEALSKRPDTAARNVLPKQERERIDYEALAVKAFRKAGYGEIKPRIDVKTYNLWLAEGFKVKPVEHGVKVQQLRLFHRSQCRELTAEEKTGFKAKADERIIANKQKIDAAAKKVVPINQPST